MNESSLLMRKQENRLTRISLGIVSLYIVCHVWRIIPTAYEAMFLEARSSLLSEWPAWLVHVYYVSHTLIVTNSAINFLIYVVLWCVVIEINIFVRCFWNKNCLLDNVL